MLIQGRQLDGSHTAHNPQHRSGQSRVIYISAQEDLANFAFMDKFTCSSTCCETRTVSFLSVFLLSVELGFCEAETTSDVDRGDHAWEETEVGSSDRTLCDFGPSNVQATRECESRSFWAEPQILMCGTQISRLFTEFNESAVSDNSTLVMKQIMLS